MGLSQRRYDKLKGKGLTNRSIAENIYNRRQYVKRGREENQEWKERRIQRILGGIDRLNGKTPTSSNSAGTLINKHPVNAGVNVTTNSKPKGDRRNGIGFDKDWTSKNANFSFGDMQDKMFDSSRKMANLQLDHSLKLMEASSKYRNKEAHRDFGFENQAAHRDFGFNNQAAHRDFGFRTKENDQMSTIRMREAGQQFGFSKALEDIKNKHLSGMQDSRHKHAKDMFGLEDTARRRILWNERAAAGNLFRGGRSGFQGHYNFKNG